MQPSGPDPWATPEPTSSSDDPVERPVPVEPLHPAHEPGFDVAPRPVVSVQREPTMSAVPDATFRLPDERAAACPSAMAHRSQVSGHPNRRWFSATGHRSWARVSTQWWQYSDRTCRRSQGQRTPPRLSRARLSASGR